MCELIVVRPVPQTVQIMDMDLESVCHPSKSSSSTPSRDTWGRGTTRPTSHVVPTNLIYPTTERRHTQPVDIPTFNLQNNFQPPVLDVQRSPWSVRQQYRPRGNTSASANLSNSGDDRMSLYNTISLPPQIDYPSHDHVLIHPLLQYPSRLRFTLSLPPVEPNSGCFEEFATLPALPSLAIQVPSVPWVVVVHASSKPYVTIGDVLYTLWQNLQTPLDPGRSSRTGRNGRRVDLLRGKERFLGLRRGEDGDESFVLCVE